MDTRLVQAVQMFRTVSMPVVEKDMLRLPFSDFQNIECIKRFEAAVW
jgi:hypothetical protein